MGALCLIPRRSATEACKKLLGQPVALIVITIIIATIIIITSITIISTICIFYDYYYFYYGSYWLCACLQGLQPSKLIVKARHRHLKNTWGYYYYYDYYHYYYYYCCYYLLLLCRVCGQAGAEFSDPGQIWVPEVHIALRPTQTCEQATLPSSISDSFPACTKANASAKLHNPLGFRVWGRVLAIETMLLHSCGELVCKDPPNMPLPMLVASAETDI